MCLLVVCLFVHVNLIVILNTIQNSRLGKLPEVILDFEELLDLDFFLMLVRSHFWSRDFYRPKIFVSLVFEGQKV